MSDQAPRRRGSAGPARRRYFAHPKALIDKSATIGANTRVWAFAHVLPHATIGESCNICDYVFIEGGASLGNGVTVKNGVSVWEGVHVEDGVFIGPSCVFTNDLFPRSFLKRPKEAWLRTTHLREGCTLGANATVVCGTTIGRFAFVAAGAVVTKDVPDYAMVVGSPAKFHSWICRCGDKLTVKLRKARCPGCGDIYLKTRSGLMAPRGKNQDAILPTRRSRPR